jgi:hypothetical protein
MPRYEYKVVPAPQKGLKAKGVRTAEARFSNALETFMNVMAEDGWDYQRAETLPSLERSGLTSTTTEWRNVLVFRRLRETAAETFAPELLPPPETTPEGDPEGDAQAAETPPKIEAPEPAIAQEPAPEETAAFSEIKPTEPGDTDTEDAVDLAGIGSSVGKLAAYRKSLKPTD